MKLTEKGIAAFAAALEHYPNESFSAASLSAKCGAPIFAATLNGIVNQGLMTRLGGSPVKFELVLMQKSCIIKYVKANSLMKTSAKRKLQRMMSFTLGIRILRKKFCSMTCAAKRFCVIVMMG